MGFLMWTSSTFALSSSAGTNCHYCQTNVYKVRCKTLPFNLPIKLTDNQKTEQEKITKYNPQSFI